MTDYFLRTRLHAIIQLMIEYQASIFGIPQDLATAIERKKNSIQNGQESNLSLFLIILIAIVLLKTGFYVNYFLTKVYMYIITQQFSLL